MSIFGRHNIVAVMRGVEITAIGIAFLAASLVGRHMPVPPVAFVVITSWVGSILVIVGVGKIFFLER